MTTLLTYDDLAAVLQTTPLAVRKLRSRSPERLPPAVLVGRNVRFHPDTVEGWLRAKDAKGQRLFGAK